MSVDSKPKEDDLSVSSYLQLPLRSLEQVKKETEIAIRKTNDLRNMAGLVDRILILNEMIYR